MTVLSKLFAAALALTFPAHAMIPSNGSVVTHQVHFDAPHSETHGGDVALPHPNRGTYRYNQTMGFHNVSSDKYVPLRVNHTSVSRPKSLPIGLVETERLNGLRSEKATLRRDIQANASAADAHGVHPYVFYLGDGTTGQGWPSRSEWLPFETLWQINLHDMENTCVWNSNGENNTPAELQQLRDAILLVSSETGVPSEYIFSIVLQESNGCVRAKWTNNAVNNGGLMQSHDGSNACTGLFPCPQDKIEGMIRDGTAGTTSGDGLKQTIGLSGMGNDADFYRAARLYNSGSYLDRGSLARLEDGQGATPCYSVDVANRLLGWNAGIDGPRTCNGD